MTLCIALRKKPCLKNFWDGIFRICDRIMACCDNIRECLPCFQESHDHQEEEIRMRQLQIAAELDESMRLPLLERNLSQHSSEDNLQLEYEDEFAARNSGILKNENYKPYPCYGSKNKYQHFKKTSTPSLTSADL